ncbi:bacteriocin fulvocin C-related protein [Streptomyces sp. NPDC013433]|uniref:bacteriocin fulvocin C-related protein n=1 Tax=Streptomyces sp. NPDC013433 TaxID=3155604 RepID=UPI0034573340
MMESVCRWILAFNASCGVCKEVAQRVERASAGRLEVLPLGHRDVQRWREQALGQNAPWAPTLLRVEGTRIRAWTGVRMGSRLAMRLGPRRSVLVLRALGDQEPEKQTDGNQTEGPRIGRRGVLRLGTGAGVAAALLWNGSVPAFAGYGKDGDPSAWVEANRERLPQAYGEFVAFPMAYRKEIFRASSAVTKSRLWVEHLRHYGVEHPDLSENQERALRHAMETLGNASLYAQSPLREQDHRMLEGLRGEVAAAFGGETESLIATLGAPNLAAADCQCSTASDYCWMGCVPTNSCVRVGGCGTGWVYTCNGWCEGP